jgi:hypothetical protein
VRRGGKHIEIRAAVHDREQSAGIGRSILDRDDARMLRELCDHIQREIAALEIRVGVEHDRNVDRVRNRAEVSLDLSILQREIRFEDREDAGRAHRLVIARLRHRVAGRRRRDAGDHRHALVGGFNRRLHHIAPLRLVEIRKLARRTERRQAVNAGFDQIVGQFAEHVDLYLAVGADRRNEVRHHTVKFGHPENPPSSRNFCSAGVVARPSALLR